MATAVDWTAGHTLTSGTFNAASTALAVAAVDVGFNVGIPGSYVLLAAAAGAAGAVVSGLAREPQLTKGSIAHRVCCWLAGGGWLTAVMADPAGPWTWGAAMSMVGITAGLSAASKGLTNKQLKAKSRAIAADAALGRARTGTEWEERIARVTSVKGCETLNVEHWKDDKGAVTGAGFTIEMKLPPGGHTWKSIQQYQDGLASDADLAEGCGVEVQAGVSRGVFLIRVQTKNMLFEVKDIPLDLDPLDFNDDFDIGYHRDGSLAMVNMRQNSGILAGIKRSGKTNQLQAFIARCMRMPNLLIWVIDFNGGGIALPWLHAWNEAGRPGKPPIDWVATNDAEALAMVQVGSAIANKRKMAYQQLMISQNTDLLPLTPELPGILIVADEGAEFLANPARRAIAEKYVNILRVAGAVGVNELTCGLRATADVMGDPMIRAQSALKVGMMMADEAELAYLFGWNHKITAEDMPDKGLGAVANGENAVPRVFKGWRVLPSHMAEITVGTAKLRGEMDQISREVGSTVYAGRWDDKRSGHLFAADPNGPAAGGVVPPAAGDTVINDPLEPPLFRENALTPEESQNNLRKAIEDAGGPAKKDLDDFDRVLSEAGVVNPTDPASWPEHLRVAADAAGVNADEPDEVDAANDEVTNLKALVFGIVKASGPKGIRPADIQHALERANLEVKIPVTKTIKRWLDVMVSDGRVYQPTGYSEYAVRPADSDQS